MKDKLNVTKGEVHIRPETEKDYIGIIVNSKLICTVYSYGDGEKEEAIANANLIADAVNTYNSCSLSPSELKQQRDELLEALREMFEKSKDLFNHCIDQYWIDPEEDPTEVTMEMESALKKTGEILTKYSNNV